MIIKPNPLAALACLMALACTVFTPSQPPTPTLAVTATVTQAPPSATMTTTLAPTPTNLPRFTPASGIATPIPMTARPATGGGAFAFGSTSGVGSASASSSSGAQAVAPIGVRESPTPITASSAANTAAPAVTPLPPENALTPTVPPTFNAQAAVSVTANRTLVVEYDLDVFRGQLILWAVAPSGQVVWQQLFTGSMTATADISNTEGGIYTVYTYAESFGGSYQIGFSTR